MESFFLKHAQRRFTAKRAERSTNVLIHASEASAGRESFRGFTLIEMLVVLAIVVVISSVVVSGESNFNKSFLLTNTAYDVALSFRSAETYGLASEEHSGTLNAGYGISVAKPPVRSYTLFADTSPTAAANALAAGTSVTPATHPGNGIYNTASELAQTYTLGAGFTLSSYCVTPSTGAAVCTSGGTLTALNIVFTRPNDSPTIMGTVSGTPISYAKACIAVSSPDNSKQYISITQSGLIALASSCP